jgi:hypothetical protein
MLSVGARGGRRMTSRSAGSAASANPGSPSVTRFGDGLHDRREVVVEQHHVGGFASDVGTILPHCHADVRSTQRWCVIHTIAGHGYDFTVRLKRLHDANFVFRGNASVYVNVANDGIEILVGHRRQLHAGHRCARGLRDAELLRDRTGGRWVIARDHDDVNAR